MIAVPFGVLAGAALSGCIYNPPEQQMVYGSLPSLSMSEAAHLTCDEVEREIVDAQIYIANIQWRDPHSWNHGPGTAAALKSGRARIIQLYQLREVRCELPPEDWKELVAARAAAMRAEHDKANAYQNDIGAAGYQGHRGDYIVNTAPEPYNPYKKE